MSPLRREALPQSWRPYTHDPVEGMADAVIITDVQNPMRGQRTFEVWTYGVWVASRHRLDDAKAYLERIYGPLNWKRQTNPPKEMVHYYFGPTTEFTEPVTFYTADLPKLGAKQAMPVDPFKGTDRNMSRRRVEQACKRILKDVAREYGYTGTLPEIDITPYLPGGVDGRYDDRTHTILLNEEFWLPRAMDKALGYENFRIFAHEAIHALFAEHIPGGSWGTAHDLEEAGAEVLSLVYWAKNAPPFDDRDSVMRGTGMTQGAATLAASLNYKDLVASLIRRVASRVGWDQQAVWREVQRLMRLDRFERHTFWQDAREAFPPSGVGTDGESLALWMIEGFVHYTAQKTAAGRLIGYHRSKVTNRESIQRLGLQAGRSRGGRNHRVYLDTVRQDPTARMDTKPTDLWEVDYTNLSHRPDPELPDRWVIVEEDVSPGRLRLVATTEGGVARRLGAAGRTYYRGISLFPYPPGLRDALDRRDVDRARDILLNSSALDLREVGTWWTPYFEETRVFGGLVLVGEMDEAPGSNGLPGSQVSPGTPITLTDILVEMPDEPPPGMLVADTSSWVSLLDRPMQVMAADYWGGHRPPEDGPPLYDLLEGDSWFPDDVYTSPHFYTFGGNEPFERESIEVVQATRGQPQAMVTIYRSLPPDADPTIGRGDWVTLSEAYARQHGMHATDPAQDWPVVSARVPARTVRNGGNDIIEWGYWGPPVRGRLGAKMARQPKPGRLVLLDVDALVRTWHLHRIDRYKRDRLVEAIEAEGLRRPPYMSGAEGDRGLAIKLLDGNHRVAAVAELGWRQVPVWVEDTIPDDELRSQGLVRGGVQTMPMATYGDFPTPYRGELGRFAKVAGIEDTMPLHEAVEALEERYADLMGAGTRQAADALSGALDVLGSDRAYGLKEAERARRLLSSPPRGSQSDDDAAIRRFLMALSRTIERLAGAYPSSRVPRYFTDELRRAWTAMEALLPRHAAGGTRWYHGTNHAFTPGDHVGPGDQHGVNHPGRNDRVWVSNNAWIASRYGSRTFEVIPDDEPRPHGNSALAQDEFHCSGAAVVREISNQEILDASNQWYRDRHPLASRQGSVADDPHRTFGKTAIYNSPRHMPYLDRHMPEGYEVWIGGSESQPSYLDNPKTYFKWHVEAHHSTEGMIGWLDTQYVEGGFTSQGHGPDDVVIVDVTVFPDHRRKGVATGLLAALREHVRPLRVVHNTELSPAGRGWSRAVGKQAARAYYHGSDREFEPGDLIQPQSETGVPNWAEQMGMDTSVMGPHYSAEHVYLADNATTAMDFGDSVYEVEPLGPVVRDPEDMGTGWYRTQGAARVVRKVVYKNRPLAKRAAHETLYHGTDRMLEPGDLLLSPAETGAAPSAPVSRLDRVYLTNDPGEAAKYGDHVYEVEALGEAEVGYWWPDHERLAPAAEIIRRVSKTAARGDGDGWIEASDGNTYWGRYGAAGLLVVHTDEEGTARFFLQQRAAWVDEGGTWGIPGGALDSHETPQQGAVREFTEETGVPGHRLGAVIDQWSFEPADDWSYTTVVVEAADQFDSHYNAEQSGTGWFTYGEMQAMRLHPGLRDSLPKIRRHGVGQPYFSDSMYHVTPETNRRVIESMGIFPDQRQSVDWPWSSEGHIFLCPTMDAARRWGGDIASEREARGMDASMALFEVNIEGLDVRHLGMDEAVVDEPIGPERVRLVTVQHWSPGVQMWAKMAGPKAKVLV